MLLFICSSSNYLHALPKRVNKLKYKNNQSFPPKMLIHVNPENNLKCMHDLSMIISYRDAETELEIETQVEVTV